ncbi:hypothetical protein [Alienimonas californiensis]|nr:hypothetical protein [Alienimonas californiensis]
MTGRFSDDLQEALNVPDETGWSIPPLGNAEVGGVFLEDEVAAAVLAATGSGPEENPAIGLPAISWPWGLEESERLEILRPSGIEHFRYAADPGPVFHGRQVPLGQVPDMLRPVLGELPLSPSPGADETIQFDPRGWTGAEVVRNALDYPVVELYRRGLDWCRVERTVIGPAALQPSLRGAKEEQCLITRFRQEDVRPLYDLVIKKISTDENRRLPRSYRLRSTSGFLIDFSVEFEVVPKAAATGQTPSGDGLSAAAVPSKDEWTFGPPGKATFRGVTFALPDRYRKLLQAFSSSSHKVLHEDAVREAVAFDRANPPTWNTVRTYFSNLKDLFDENYLCVDRKKVIEITNQAGDRYVTLNDDLLRPG